MTDDSQLGFEKENERKKKKEKKNQIKSTNTPHLVPRIDNSPSRRGVENNPILPHARSSNVKAASYRHIMYILHTLHDWLRHQIDIVCKVQCHKPPLGQIDDGGYNYPMSSCIHDSGYPYLC